MNYLLLNFIIALWIESATSFFIGILFLIKGTQKSHKLFAVLALDVSWWTFCQIWMVACDSSQTALFWGRIGYASATFIAPFFMHFIINFLQIKNRNWFLRVVYLTSFIAASLKFTKYGIEYVAPKFYTKYYLVPNIGFHFSIAIFWVCTFYSFWKLFIAYRNSSGKKQNQLKYLFCSMLFGFSAGTANFLLAYNINLPFSPFLTYLGSIWALIAAYAIFRHHLMDITIVIKRTAVYSMLVTLITVSYFILIYIAESFFRGFVGYKSMLLTIGFLVIFTLAFQPLKNIIQSFIDKYFFKGSQAILAEELQKAQEELKRIERLKAVGTLAAGMAHEIKNPLTGIKTFTEYLPEKYNEPGFVDKFHKIVSTEVDKINSIVQQLLDFSKPKQLQLQEVNIHQIIDQTLSLLSNSLIKYKIALVRNYDTSLPSVRMDPNQMQQVFCNLFLYAIEAMKGGGKLTVSTSQTNNTIQITISDTGKGITQKDLEHIFDPFYTTKETGTGLGMSIIYGIVKEHKGDIKVESKENK
ncbi:MAG: ATP-binding protein, partial [Candidatus Omnitrophica bacterium]|nr:ATP-binding protein [Candidatus Omnitrophota bacterium]